MKIKNCKLKIIAKREGFTLVEILIAMAIFGIVAGIVGLSLFNFKRKQDLDGDKVRITALMNDARSRAIASEGGKRFGVRLRKDQGGDEFYQLVELPVGGTAGCYSVGNAPSATIVETHSLKSSISFLLPGTPGDVWDVVFLPLSGTPDLGSSCPGSETRITIEGSSDPLDKRSIFINDSGTITSQ